MRLIRTIDAPHTGFDLVPPPGRPSTPHDLLRDAPRPGSPAHAGSAPTRLLEIAALTSVHDQRGAIVDYVHAGDVVPVAKGIGAAGQVVHIVTDGPLAGRVIYRHRPSYMIGGARQAIPGGEGPA